MIAYLKGKVMAVTAESVIVLAGGIGYEVFCSGAAFAAAQQGPEVELFTYLQVKEDGFTLFGFISPAEKRIFLDLISVSGVGPKLGITILNGMPADEVARCIAMADTTRLSRVKGLGKKTAEKIVLELHGKVTAEELLAANGMGQRKTVKEPVSPVEEEAVEALIGLGFTATESKNAVKAARERGATDVEGIIRFALASM